jgi:hypothetical protein
MECILKRLYIIAWTWQKWTPPLYHPLEEVQIQDLNVSIDTDFNYSKLRQKYSDVIFYKDRSVTRVKFQQRYTMLTLWLVWVLGKKLPLDLVKLVAGKHKVWMFEKNSAVVPVLGEFHVESMLSNKCVISYFAVAFPRFMNKIAGFLSSYILNFDETVRHFTRNKGWIT